MMHINEGIYRRFIVCMVVLCVLSGVIAIAF